MWETIDNHLANLEGLEEVALTQVISGCLSGLMGIPGYDDKGLFAVFRRELMQTAEGLLPRCNGKGLLVIKQLPSSWTSSAFAGTDLPDK